MRDRKPCGISLAARDVPIPQQMARSRLLAGVSGAQRARVVWVWPIGSRVEGVVRSAQLHLAVFLDARCVS
jgi:hypothetical protein